MNKKAIATLFTVLFMAIIIAPAVIVTCDSSIDTSIFFSLNEEEEENGELKNIKVFFTTIANNYNLFQDLSTLQYSGNGNNNYLNPYLKLTSPPPKY